MIFYLIKVLSTLFLLSLIVHRVLVQSHKIIDDYSLCTSKLDVPSKSGSTTLLKNTNFNVKDLTITADYLLHPSQQYHMVNPQSHLPPLLLQNIFVPKYVFTQNMFINAKSVDLAGRNASCLILPLRCL